MRLAARLRRSRHGIFYFRLLIPKALRPLFAGRREVQGSLGTADRQRAVLAAHVLSAQALALFVGLKLAMANDSKNDKRGSLPVSPISIISKYEIRVSPQRGIQIKTDPSKPEEHAQALEMVKELERIGFANVLSGSSTSLTRSDPKEVAMPLEGSIRRYVAGNGERWGAKTKAEYGGIFKRFQAFVGRRHVHDITKKTIADYLASLTEAGIKARTRDKHLMVLARYFESAISSEEYRGDNPTKGQYVFTSTERKKLKGWEPFDAEDLTEIFNPANYARLKKPHEFWFPALGLFTGARISELAQLALTDIGEEKGIASISINDEDDRKVKSEAAIRTIPIHPVLLKMGFLDYVEDVRKVDGAERVFPYLRCDAFGSYADVPGEAFRRYLNSLDVAKKPGRVFHSFRKSANNTLKQAGVGEEHRCAMVGHAHDTVNSSIYGKKLGVTFLNEHVIPKLEFNDLDFAALRYARGRFDRVLGQEVKRRGAFEARKERRATLGVRRKVGRSPKKDG